MLLKFLIMYSDKEVVIPLIGNIMNWLIIIILLIGCASHENEDYQPNPSLDVQEASLIYLVVDIDSTNPMIGEMVKADLGQKAIFVLDARDPDFLLEVQSLNLSTRTVDHRVDTRPLDSPVKNVEPPSLPERPMNSTNRVEVQQNQDAHVAVKVEEPPRQITAVGTDRLEKSLVKDRLSNRRLSKIELREFEVGSLLKKDAFYYRGMKLASHGELYQRLSKGIQPPKMQFSEDGFVYQGNSKTQNMYMNASMKIMTEVQRVSNEANTIRNPGLNIEVVFKLKAKKDSVADRSKNRKGESHLDKFKLVDVYGKIKPEQILGYYLVHNGDIGQYYPNDFRTAPKRLKNKLKDGVNTFQYRMSTLFETSYNPNARGIIHNRMIPNGFSVRSKGLGYLFTGEEY